MHKEYWVAIVLYAVAVVLTALPFLGIVRIDLGLGYETLKFLHIVFVFVAISVLVGQLITYNVMQHARITTQEALRYLSLLDHVIPVCLVIIGVLGYSMAARHGEVWEVAWIHESAFGLLIYAVCGLILTLIFRRIRFRQEGGNQSSGGVYVASGIGIVFLVLMTAVMVYKAAPLRTAHHFTAVAKYLRRTACRSTSGSTTSSRAIPAGSTSSRTSSRRRSTAWAGDPRCATAAGPVA